MRVVICLVLLVGCADPEPPPEPPLPWMAEEPGSRPGVRLDRLLDADSTTLAQLHPPHTRHAEPAGTPGDSLVTMLYDGLSVTVLHPAEEQPQIHRVVVSEASYGTRDGVSIGEARADLEAVLRRSRGSASGVPTYRDLAGHTVEVTYAPDDAGVERAILLVWRLGSD